MLTKAWTKLRYHPEQQRLWTCGDRFIAVRAGRGSGKSTIVLRKLVRKLPEKTKDGAPGKYFFTAPTRDQSKRISWELFKSLIHPGWLAKEPSESELKITTIWGSELHVLGFDKPQRLEGIQWHGGAVDESSDIKPNAVNLSLMPALTVRQGFLWRLGVPKRTGVGAKEFKQVCKSPDYTFFEWSSEDLLPQSEIDRQRSLLDPLDYAEQIQGKALDVGGSAFYSFSLHENVDSSKETAYHPDEPIIVGSDFNVDPMAWVLCHIRGGKVYVFDELFIHNTNTVRTLDKLHSKYGDHKAGWIFTGDASSRARKTAGSTATPSDYLAIKNDPRFAREGAGVKIQYPKSNPPIKDRLASCNAMLCTYDGTRRVKISPTCLKLIEDLEARDLDDKGQPTDADKYGGHITDAFGYVLHRFFPPHTVRSEGVTPVKSSPQLTLISE